MANQRKYTLISLFSGYDSQAIALREIGKLGRLVAYAEIKPAAIKVHEALWPGVPNLGDVASIDWRLVEKSDILTYSFPCQDLSTMGKGGGLEQGSGTRSSLLWEVAKAVSSLHPDYLLSENVPQCRVPSFARWLDFLGEEGYVTSLVTSDSWQHGSLQHRMRTFALSRRSLSLPVVSCRRRQRATWDDVIDRSTEGLPVLQVAERLAASPQARKSRLTYGRITAATSDGRCHIWNGSSEGGAMTIMERDGTRGISDLGWSVMRRKSMWVSSITDSGKVTMRHLNGLESLRLMGVPDDVALTVVDTVGSKAAHRLAGDSIVVEQLADMFEALLNEERGLPLPLGTFWQDIEL